MNMVPHFMRRWRRLAGETGVQPTCSSGRAPPVRKRAERMWPDTEPEESSCPASPTSTSQHDALPPGQVLSIALPVGGVAALIKREARQSVIVGGLFPAIAD